MDDKNIVIERSLSGRRHWRFGGRVVSQFQVVVGLLGVLVCLLVVFGVGFLFGLWYQANEPIMPRDDAVALAEEQLKQLSGLEPSQPEMTFYSTLTTPETSEPPFPADASRPEAAPLSSAPDTSARAIEDAMIASEGTAAMPEAEGRAAPSVVTVPPATAGPDATPPVAPAPDAASQAARTAPQPSGSAPGYYSVQVGSFRLAEQAQQLQQQLVEKGYAARLLLNLIPGNGVWYRVRVGKFNEREDADQVAQRLRAQESMEVLVMRESS